MLTAYSLTFYIFLFKQKPPTSTSTVYSKTNYIFDSSFSSYKMYCSLPILKSAMRIKSCSWGLCQLDSSSGLRSELEAESGVSNFSEKL